jgi:uncharacterized protein YbjT (DUF2867 family)
MNAGARRHGAKTPARGGRTASFDVKDWSRTGLQQGSSPTTTLEPPSHIGSWAAVSVTFAAGARNPNGPALDLRTICARRRAVL